MSFIHKIFGRNPAYKQAPLDIELVNSISNDRIEEGLKALESGANPNSFDKSSLPAILLSASRQQSEIVQKLIEKGADVNATGTEKKQSIFNLSALAASSANGDIETVKALINAKANLNIMDRSGLTPLMSASYMGNN
jgi:ankyrin repeat protein